MVWELAAIWAIVIATLVWFVRDERRRRTEADIARAARYYAHAPRYRHLAVEPVPLPIPVRRTGGLTEAQRNALRALQR